MPPISVFTPSHDPQFLDDCYVSLKAQTFQDWEWIVLLNGGAEWEPPCYDERIRIDSTPWTRGIGALKAEAVSCCRGELLVEFDHDDRLVPTALETLWDSALGSPRSASLYYSDTAQMNEQGGMEISTFDFRHGWEYEGVDVDGQNYLSFKAMEPTPHNVSYIWYAPNHVRAFPRWAYDQVGGYDPNLDILDDQDLMARLYLVGPFCHIPEPLYIQRVHGSNAQKDPVRNARIQTETVAMYDRNIDGAARAWAKREGLRCLDLGGAHNPAEGYETVDIHKGADIQADVIQYLCQGCEENSIGVIRASDFLEHIAQPIVLMNAIWHALAPGGMLLSCTPSTDGRGAFQDPTHRSWWCQNSFWYYTDPNIAKYVPEITARFQVSRLRTFYPSDWHEEHDISYVEANLIAVKDGGVRNGGFLLW